MTVDFEQSFPQLTEPPVVEATIQWVARPTVLAYYDNLQDELRSRLTWASRFEPIHLTEVQAMIDPLDGGTPPVVHHRQGNVGLRMTSADGHTVAQFTNDGVSFSVLQKYNGWESFRDLALESWRAFLDLAQPTTIHQLGVRYINRFATATAADLSDFLNEPPSQPGGMPMRRFLYESQFKLPGYPYGVRIVKLMDVANESSTMPLGLFLDITAHTTGAISNDGGNMIEHLKKLRWLKNNVFFGLLCDEAVKNLGGVL